VAITTFTTPTFTKPHITSPTDNSTLTSDTMTVTWDKNDASSIRLYVRDETHGTYLFHGSVTSTSKSVPVPTNGERIKVELYSTNPNGGYVHETIYVNAKNNPTPTVPNTPTNLHASHVDKTTATLTWRDNSNNETGFKVYQGTSTTPVATLGANVRRYTATGLTADTSYTYKVKAYNSAGESAAATTTFRTLQDTPTFTKAHITSPTNNSILTSNTMTVTWDKNDASSIFLQVHDDTHGRNLFSGYVTSSTSKSVPVPTHGENITIIFQSYDALGHIKGTKRLYVTAKNQTTLH